VRPATSMFPQALRCVPGKQLLEFTRKSHSEMI
jgi:hypothetical protein